MPVKSVVGRCVTAAVLLCFVSAFRPPSAAAQYADASLLGVLTEPGGSTTLTLPAQTLFPQFSRPDVSLAQETTVSVSNGAEFDFFLTLATPGGAATVPGKLRLTVLQAQDPDAGGLAYLIGTFSLTADPSGSPYEISGPAVGDGYAVYLAAKDTSGTAGDTSDDTSVLIRVNLSSVPGADPLMPAYITGPAQMLLGSRDVVRTMTGQIVAAQDAAPVPATITTFTDGSVFNQITPPDGSGDKTLGAAASGLFVPNVQRTGTFAGAGIFKSSGSSLLVTDASIGGGAVLAARFSHAFADGTSLQGFLVGDLGGSVGGVRPVYGFIFSLSTPDATPTLLFGTFTGETDGNTGLMTVAVDAPVVATVSAPPQPWFAVVQDDQLPTTGYRSLWTGARDLNGAADVKTLSLMINDGLAQNRIVGRYQADKNRLWLYNRATRKWVGSCAPGMSGTLRTPWVALSCKGSEVVRFGEYLQVGWSLKPAAKMAGTWPVYLKVQDRANQVDGWQPVAGVEIGAP